MTDFSSRAEAIRSRCEAATPGPWAWEWVAEKSNEWAVGQAFDAAGRPVEVAVDDGVEDTIIERRLVGMNESGHANAADADFIAHARRDLPDALAEIARLTAQVETLQAERDKWLKAFNESEQFQNGPTKRADAAEAQVTELQGLLGTATTLAATHFDRANAAEAQVTQLQAERDANKLALHNLRAAKSLLHDIWSLNQFEWATMPEGCKEVAHRDTVNIADALLKTETVLKEYDAEQRDVEGDLNLAYADLAKTEAQVTALRALLRACADGIDLGRQ